LWILRKPGLSEVPFKEKGPIMLKNETMEKRRPPSKNKDGKR